MWSCPMVLRTVLFPAARNLTRKRKTARKRLLEVASALTGETIPEDAFLMATSGRYEFRNKGIDLFIDALGELNKEKIVQDRLWHLS